MVIGIYAAAVLLGLIVGIWLGTLVYFTVKELAGTLQEWREHHVGERL